MLGGVNTKPISIELDVTLADDHPSGRAHVAHAEDREFSGWLGLMSAIGALCAAAERPERNPMTTNTLSQSPPAELPPLVLPDSEEYDSARTAWNLHADQRPAAVCVARTVEDVQAVVRFAREQGLRVAPQATGHMGAVLPSLERTVLLKLALHDGQVEVEPEARVARVRAGAVWDDVVAAVTPHGLAAMHGSSPSVGVIGYLLGGGLSFYGRKHGLAANHVRAFEVVTADGSWRWVDEEHDPELFFALRGGGGGYAIVTAVEIGLLPYADVNGGAMFFPAQHAFALLRTWRDWTAHAPESVTTTFRVLCLPPMPEVPEPLQGVPTVCIDGVALGTDDLIGLEQRLRWVSSPILGGFGTMPSAAVARLHGDPEAPVPAIGDAMLLEKLDDWAIEVFLRCTGPGSPLLAAEIRHLGGALGASPDGAGARGHLEGEYLLFGVGVPGMPACAEDLSAHLDRYLGSMRPWATGTMFSSFAERRDTLEGCVPRRTLERLSRTRQLMDPHGILVAPHLPPAV